MSDYIDRKKLLKKKQYSFQTEYGAFPRHDYFIKLSDIRSMPTVDTEKHAHWIQIDSYGNFWKCSNCGESNVGKTNYGPGKTNFCSNCGAKMDKNKIKEK